MQELVSVVTSVKPDRYSPRIVQQERDYLYVEYESPVFGVSSSEGGQGRWRCAAGGSKRAAGTPTPPPMLLLHIAPPPRRPPPRPAPVHRRR
jgi:hypothetical protein